ncbi:MAG: hypothetical protein RIQ79_140 [Verrucomicrobiota bacterium]
MSLSPSNPWASNTFKAIPNLEQDSQLTSTGTSKPRIDRFHPAGFAAFVILPQARWSNAREALALSLSESDALHSNDTSSVVIPKAPPAITSRPLPAPAPAPAPLPVPAKVPALRIANPAASLIVEVPSSPVSKIASAQDVSSPAAAGRPTPDNPTPLAPLSTAPFPAALAAKSSSPPTEASSEQPAAKKVSRLSPATTAPFSTQEGTRPPIKLRVAARPAAPSPNQAPPPSPSLEALPPPAPAALPLFPQEETPLLPIPGIGAGKRRATPSQAESTPSGAPFVSSHTQPAFSENKSPVPAYNIPPDTQDPPLLPLLSAPSGNAHLTRPPLAKVTPSAAKKKARGETPKSAPLVNAGRILGYALIVAILGVIANTLYRSYKNLHNETEAGAAAATSTGTVDSPATTAAAASSPPSTAKPDDPNQSPAPPGSPPPQNANPPPPSSPAPTDEFIAAVNSLKVTGVLIGKPLRVIINGRRIEPGDLVNEKLGIRLVGHEIESRSLIFEDRTKAQSKLRY